MRNFLSRLKPHKKGTGEKNEQLVKILESLEGLVQQKDTLGLIERIGEKSWLPKLPTTSLLADSNVYGRDGDEEAIVKLLLSDTANGKKVGVIPVWGMGGVGKTTLAQLVYNNTTVQQRFDVKGWVCVSQEMDMVKVTKDILKVVGSVNCDAMIPEEVHRKLQECLSGKNFLLVLDDVWNDDRNAWSFLLTPLRSGLLQGSKIIVTAREERVASAVSTVLTDATVSTYHLNELSPDDCWLLFEKHAFDEESSIAREDLEEIGGKIVRKCKGLPLAAKTLGGLLRSNTDAEEWEKVLESDMWDLQEDTILPALRLSFHYLPSHLKQCFIYCSLFPKDYEFRKEDLVLLWMAEGFLEQPKGKVIEGNKCFDDLVSRSFFQQSSVNPSCFIMHDLINDLAKIMAGEFYLRFEDDGSSKASEKARHLSYARTKYNVSENFDGLARAQFLRSFLLIGWPRWLGYGDNSRKLDYLQSLVRLRVLYLSQYYVAEIPDSIGNLKHLRYLNLQTMPIVRLPESVTSLYNLQTLILFECESLIELPSNTMKLINLCHLDIRQTGLQLMPPQMGKLTKLTTLTDFFVGEKSGYSISELGKLQDLQGRLCIWNLQNVVNVQDAMEANLKSKKQLKELKMTWRLSKGDVSLEQVDDSIDMSEHLLRVLEQLQPHPKVKCLSLDGYGATRFPDWVGDSSFSNIVSLRLENCGNCISLPPLGQLTSLKELSIDQFDAVVTVGLEFYGHCTSMKKPFRSLEILRLAWMLEWQEWMSDVAGAFPLLRELYIIRCPKLTKALPSHFPSLTTLEIMDSNEQLVASLPRVPTICKLKLDNCGNSGHVVLKQLASGLYSLYVVGGSFSLDSAIKQIERVGVVSSTLEEIDSVQADVDCACLGDLISLKLFKISYCSNLVFLPQGGMSAPNLIRLHLSSCRNLQSLPEGMAFLLPSLKELHIYECPEIESIPGGGFPSKLESLDINYCYKLCAKFGIEWDLQLLPCLNHFGIEVESFPGTKQLPSTLTSLRIEGVQNLESLDYKQLQQLTSLRKLRIRGWPQLQSLRLQHLNSLEELEICRCPEVEFILEDALPSTLTFLDLDELYGLECLEIQHLTSLNKVSLIECPYLELSPEALPSSLSDLYILECPNLACFSKITHIQSVQIYDC